MSSASDTEEFYDAEEISEKSSRSSGRRRLSNKVPEEFIDRVASTLIESVNIVAEKELEEAVNKESKTSPASVSATETNLELVTDATENLTCYKVVKESSLTDETEANVRREIEKRHLKLEEARRRMRTEGDEENVFDDRSSISTTGSCSSMDGLRIRPLNSSSCSHCATSGASTCSHFTNVSSKVPMLTISSADNAFSKAPAIIVLQEPDLVISTKASVAGDQQQLGLPLPIAPPRRKRKGISGTAKPCVLNTNEDQEAQGIPSPASTIESLTKEFEHSLDLPSATSGQYVVKPQDEEKTKADGPSRNSPYVLCIEEGSIVGDFTIGDEAAMTKQLNMVLRTRTDSGKELTDIEILEQVTVLNLDTGERIPLSLAEDRLPQGVNPLSLHIMRLTSEYVSNSSLEKNDSDDDSVKSKSLSLPGTLDNMQVKKKTAHFKRLLNRTVEKTVNKIKSVADEVYHAKHNEDTAASECSDEDAGVDVKQSIKFKSSSSHKGPYEFNNLKLIQDLSGEHSGAVWTMKFSVCGRLLATVGQDHILRIWVLKDSFDYFNDMRQKYNTEARLSPTPSQESFASLHSAEGSEKASSGILGDFESDEFLPRIFAPKPFCTFAGHTADLLDVSWSKNYFILSSSMDKTVRLWHISRKECLCCFQHIDFVTAIAFHPRDDRYFLSGSLDGKLRLWNIPDKKVALWNELDGQTKLITSANFCQNGKFAVVGTYDGRCIFYTTEQLKYYTQIHVRSTRGKNAKGRKISGIEPMPGEDKILVTSNDSRVRLYDLRDLSLSCKYKGYANLSSQIRASFSHDGKFIVTGSENQNIYLWKTQHDYAKFSSARKDRNDYWESIKVHNAVVTAAVFAPNPRMIFHQMEQQRLQSLAASGSVEQLPHQAGNDAAGQSQLPTSGLVDGHILVTADFSGGVKVFINKIRTQQKDT